MPSCFLLDQECIEAPPTQGFFQTREQADKETREWWQHRIQQTMSRNLLAVYAETSAVHMRQHTAATYSMGFAYRTAGHSFRLEYRLLSPPPDYVWPWISDRLQGYLPCDPKVAGTDYSHWWIKAEDCCGCTAEEAVAIWEEAERKIGKGKVRE
jgi:hypothetical protein